MLRIAALLAIILFAFSTITASARAKRACAQDCAGVGGTMLLARANVYRSMNRRKRMEGKARHVRLRQHANAGKKGKKCAKGFNACLSYKMKLDFGRGKAARFCHHICG